MSKTSDNQKKAPMSAAFVSAMREAFGEENIEILYVKEGDLELGELDLEPTTAN